MQTNYSEIPHETKLNNKKKEKYFSNLNDEDSIKALSLAKQSNTNDIPQTSNLKLSGIFFVDEQNWTVWIDGNPYSEIGQHENFSIDEVSESEVTITTSDGDTSILSVN